MSRGTVWWVEEAIWAGVPVRQRGHVNGQGIHILACAGEPRICVYLKQGTAVSNSLKGGRDWAVCNGILCDHMCVGTAGHSA